MASDVVITSTPGNTPMKPLPGSQVAASDISNDSGYNNSSGGALNNSSNDVNSNNINNNNNNYNNNNRNNNTNNNTSHHNDSHVDNDYNTPLNESLHNPASRNSSITSYDHVAPYECRNDADYDIGTCLLRNRGQQGPV